MRIQIKPKDEDHSYQRWFAWRPVKVLTYNDRRPVIQWVWLEWLERCLYQRTTDNLGIQTKRYTYSLIHDAEKTTA